MKYVLDASAFFSEWREEGEYHTVPLVLGELHDARARLRLELFAGMGLRVHAPSAASRERVLHATVRTGDAGVLSPADRDLLALALELDGVLVTDDFAVQNVAHALGIATRPIIQRAARPRRWRFRCVGCGVTGDAPGECPVCGAAMKRSIKP